MTHQPESVSPTHSPSITLAELPDFAQKCLQKLGIADLKPVQASVYPMAVAGRDVLVQAPTGSGKTLAMALPVVQRLTTLERSRDPRVLVLCPTRELSSQVTQVFDPLLRSLGMSVTTVTGGASEKYQRTRLAQGSDVIVGTPGRIRDLSERGVLNLKSIQIFALDEVDQMLDIGFKEDLEIIMGLKAPETQTLFFSATINGLTRKMCSRLLKDPGNFKLDNHEHKPQIEHVSMAVKRGTEAQALANLLLLEKCDNNQAIIFCETRMECEDVTRTLQTVGLQAEALHGDIVQAKRTKTLQDFKARRIDYLVATNVAARGIDVSHLPLVINFRLPWDSETYVHRVGRTGRAGLAGRAVTFFDNQSRAKLQRICRELNITPTERSVPTPAEIQERSLVILRDKLLEQSTLETRPSDANLSKTWEEFRSSLNSETFESVFRYLFLKAAQPHAGFEVQKPGLSWQSGAAKNHSAPDASDRGGPSSRPRRPFGAASRTPGSSRPGSDRFGSGSKPRFGSQRPRPEGAERTERARPDRTERSAGSPRPRAVAERFGRGADSRPLFGDNPSRSAKSGKPKKKWEGRKRDV
jgi:ATP-dependent RNA helicase DeaD